MAKYEKFYPGEEIEQIRYDTQIGAFRKCTIRVVEEGHARNMFTPAWICVDIVSHLTGRIQRHWTYKRFYRKLFPLVQYQEDQPQVDDDDL